MQVPPQQIFDQAEKLLGFGERDSFELRSSTGTMRGMVTANDVLWLAHNMRIEAITTKGGTLRHFRELPEDVVAALVEQKAVDEASDDVTTGTSTAFARTNQGVFREHLREAQVDQDGDGFRRVVGEGGFVSICYTHCGHQNLKFKNESKSERRQAA